MTYHSLISVKNLGFFSDETLSMDAHIQQLCRIVFCQARRQFKTRPSLSTDAASKLAVSFILTRLDYYNSLPAGLPDNKLNKLQRIKKIPTVLLVIRKHKHVSATLQFRGRYHGGRRPPRDDSFHSPTVIPPSALDKPSIMKSYNRR